MLVIKERNVHHMLPELMYRIHREGLPTSSRNGPTLTFPTPVTLEYTHPKERVMFHALRDANPFFHLIESFWMLSGSDQIAALKKYVKTIVDFSDDGKTHYGAYGYRWRNYFQHDQLDKVVELLGRNPRDRRIVLQMWDADADLGQNYADHPCNTQALFGTQTGKLDMLITNRSNDIIWGACGANAVHMSVLQQVVAEAIGMEVGTYRQMSVNLHAYDNDLLKRCTPLGEQARDPIELHPPDSTRDLPIETWKEPEICRSYRHIKDDSIMLMRYIMASPGDDVHVTCRKLLEKTPNQYFRKVLLPIVDAHAHYRVHKASWEKYQGTFDLLKECQSPMWRVACTEWVERKRDKWLRALEDGPSHE